MQSAEEPLERAAVEDAGEDGVAARNGSEAVAVAEAEDLAGNGRDIGLLKSLHAERLEVGVAPDIVVAAKEIDVHPAVDEVDDCSKNPSITSWDNIAVLIPKVPDVPEHVEAFRLRRQRFQKAHEARLPVLRVQNVTAEVHVGDEICEVS